MIVDGGEWDVSNQSQIWSSYAVSGDATGVFNGTLDYYSTNGVGFQVYDLQLQSAGLTASSSIEVMFESQTDFGNSVTINGINVIPFAVRQPANTWCDVTAEVGLGRIDTIIAATGGSSITAIVGFRIDGKLLIDAVNDSQVWSNYLTTGTGSWESSTPSGQDWSGAYKPSLAFNGKLTQSTMGYGDPCFSLSEGHYIYFEPQEPFTDVVSVEYYGDKSYARNIGINQESTAATTNPAAPTQDGSLSPFGEWVSVVNPPSTINRMWFKAWSGANGSTAVRGIKINGKLLVDAGVRDLGDTEVTGPTNGATGKFGGATGNTATVTDVTGRWVANDNGKGEQFFMEPTVPQADQVAELFCDLAIEGDKAVVKSLSGSDPGFLPITDKDYSVKFNSQLASGEAPDDALPNGTQIEVTVKATNEIGSDEETSNALTPTAPNPDGSAGPITAANWADGNTLTVGSSTNLDTFTADDTVKMVDANGAIASYKPTTSPITNVSGTTLTFTNSQDIKYFNVGDILKSNKNLVGLKFILSEKPGGGSLRPDKTNFYIGGVFSNGMLLTDSAHFSDPETQIDIGTATDDGNRYPGGWANGIVDDVPNKENGTGWRGFGDLSNYEATIGWFNNINITKLKILMHHGDGPNDYLCTIKDQSGDTIGTVDLDGDKGQGAVFIEFEADTNYEVYSVVSRDPDARTITVNDGTLFFNNEIVSAPLKSGVGTFVSTNLTDEIVVKDSNDQWIDNQNRLGINFYVKEMNAFLKAGNARDEAEYQAIADAFAAYPGKVTTRRTSVSTLIAQLAATLSEADAALLYDAVDFEQPHADQGPFAIQGYYPLYTTQEASDAIGGSSHAHTFDGVTYYMPDNGVTIYHGNYTG